MQIVEWQIVVADEVRTEAATIVGDLHQRGYKTVLLSGDALLGMACKCTSDIAASGQNKRFRFSACHPHVHSCTMEA